MIGGMIVLILTNGLGFFWPRPLSEVTLKDGTVLMGEIEAREAIPAPGTPDHLKRFRVQFKLGNRDVTGVDFRWVNEADIVKTEQPLDAVDVERREDWLFIGRLTKLTDGDRDVATGSEAVLAALPAWVARAAADRDAIRDARARRDWRGEQPDRRSPPAGAQARPRSEAAAGRGPDGPARGHRR